MRLGFIGNVGFNGGRLKTKETEEEPLEQGKGCGDGEGGGWKGATMHSTHLTRVLNFSVDS